MLRAGILLIAVIVSIAMLLIPSIPLGVPGEWVWPRLALPEDLAEFLDRLLIPIITAAGLVTFCRYVDCRIRRYSALKLGIMLGLLVAGSFCWINAVRQAAPSPHRELRPLWVLYHKYASGYFYEAAFRTASRAELLSTYESRMTKGDVFHEGTHPPGLFLLNWWAIQATAGSEILTAASLWTQPSSTIAMFRKLESETQMARPLSRTEFAALCLVSFLSTVFAAMALIPVFGIVTLISDVRSAWRAASLVPTIPTISIFAPRSDVIYAFSATLLLWMLIESLVAISPLTRRFCCLLAGGVAFVSLTLSLAHLPVLVAGAAFTGMSLMGSDRLAPRRMVAGALLMISAWSVLFVAFWAVSDCNLLSIWKMNLANHAAFYRQFTRTWWKWGLVNPLELSMAVGLPITVFSVFGFIRCLRFPANSRETIALNAVRLILAMTGTWLLLWLSGKNMGEAARLWCFLTPWFVIVGTMGLMACNEASTRLRLESAEGACSPSIRAAGARTESVAWDNQREWLMLLIAQFVVCTVTVGRVSGYLDLVP